MMTSLAAEGGPSPVVHINKTAGAPAVLIPETAGGVLSSSPVSLTGSIPSAVVPMEPLLASGDAVGAKDTASTSWAQELDSKSAALDDCSLASGAQRATSAELLNLTNRSDCASTCRICFFGDTEQPLLEPCNCRGTIGFVHRECLERLIQHRMDPQCQICHFRFTVRKQSEPAWRLLSNVEARRAVLAYMFLCVVFALGIAFVFTLAWMHALSLPPHVGYKLAGIVVMMLTVQNILWLYFPLSASCTRTKRTRSGAKEVRASSSYSTQTRPQDSHGPTSASGALVADPESHCRLTSVLNKEKNSQKARASEQRRCRPIKNNNNKKKAAAGVILMEIMRYIMARSFRLPFLAKAPCRFKALLLRGTTPLAVAQMEPLLPFGKATGAKYAVYTPYWAQDLNSTTAAHDEFSLAWGPQRVTSADSLNHSSNSDGAPTCRICFCGDEKQPLLKPCNCRGTIGFVHRECLERWIERTADHQCQVCHFRFAVRKQPEPAWRLLSDVEARRPVLGYMLLCAVFALGIAFIFCLAWMYAACLPYRVGERLAATVVVMLAVQNVLWLYFPIVSFMYSYKAYKKWREGSTSLKLVLSTDQHTGPSWSNWGFWRTGGASREPVLAFVRAE
ncbi:hypothetical protein HPB50_008518 [Hyalomma asiaticum]|uniref:Uncharacterized protein n=1 Tax=Hyalomma asiaticum TaxID=266040 RepID=A0ACB7SD68_HYAAI|nr:hypothetical protein HPB50_008518 [Hyalomma asiaticum]